MTEPPNEGPDFSKPQQPGYGPPNPQGPGTPDPYGSTQYGQTPPPQQPPGYGQQPPSYGQQPPGYGQQPPGYGQQPPPYGQQPGYGAPESGAPAGGYGAVPPGATPPPYGAPGAGVPGAPGAPTGAPQQVNVGEALSWAWAQFKANPGPMIVPGLIMFLIGGVMVGVYFAIIALSTSTTTETIDNGYGGTYSYNVQTSSLGAGGLLLGIVLYVVVFVAIMYLSASMITGALRVADGQPVSVATFLKPDRFGPVVGTAIVVGLITAVGLVLCIIPGLIAIFLLQFSIFFVIDKKLGLGAAMSASTNLSRSSVSNSLLTLVVAYVLSYIGTILCYIGLIVTWPLGQLFYAHCYRRLTGSYVAPAPV
ncbi:hypothetical protein [Gordonia polyisoprenivorans]|uniref:hypothetical protein n=1 Tax=Gordonia polyisoprenivorans TaxID=84595 RepID=UPI002301C89A|nr:hypothetical protein [Gordonia polyisoprenivorans]WCB36715.1 hypothetical protein PHA63_22095 [Gordonia polyisoprenivorans]